MGLVPPPGADPCGVTDVPIGTGRLFGRVIIVRSAEGIFRYENICPHERITLNLQKNVRTIGAYILCDHHYARFRFDDGISNDGVCAGKGLSPNAIEDGRPNCRPETQ